MNVRLLTIILLIVSGSLFVTGCGDTSSFEASSTSGTLVNDGLISQKNLTLLFSETKPKFLDVTTGEITPVTSTVSVQIGDNKNQLITDSHTIHFKTEWGLIEPSCVTVNGGCSVNWESGSFTDMPANFLSRVLAYSLNGQETFTDIDGNGSFNDGDTFEDLVEPFIDTNESGDFDSGDFIVDVVNGIDLTGSNNQHDTIDGLYNGPNCTHSSLCSTTLKTSTVWESGSFDLTGGTNTSGGSTFSNITLLSDIPAENFEDGTTILQPLLVFDIFMGDSNSPIVYRVKGNTDGIGKLFRLETTGDIELGSNLGISTGYIAISDDGTTIIHADGNDKSIIDIAGITTQLFGTADFTNLLNISVNGDASLVTYISAADLTGANPGNIRQIFTLTTDGTDIFTQATSFVVDPFTAFTREQATISGDGSKIFFHSTTDVLNDGSNADGSDEIFSINSDGSGLAQITNIDIAGDDIVEIKTDASGSIVVFSLISNTVTAGQPGSNSLYSVNVATTTTTKIATLFTSQGDRTLPLTNTFDQFDLSSDGNTVIYTTSLINLSEFQTQIFSVNSDGTNTTERFITDTSTSSMSTAITFPEISSDGSIIIFKSNYDFGKTSANQNATQIYTLN